MNVNVKIETIAKVEKLERDLDRLFAKWGVSKEMGVESCHKSQK